MVQIHFLTSRLRVHGYLSHFVKVSNLHRPMHTGASIMDSENVQVCESGESQTAILFMKRKR